MEKTTMGLIAAIGALAATPAAANVSAISTESVMKPASIAEFLEPISNATEVMQHLRAEQTLAPVEAADAAEFTARYHHHHHHHHWRIFPRYHHHHHHHFFRRHHHHHYHHFY